MRKRTSLDMLTLTRLSVVAAFLLLSTPASAFAAQSTHAEHGHTPHARPASSPTPRASRISKKRSKAARKKVATPKATAHGAVVYFCPMHPEVTSGAPGTCPKCRMDLEAQKPGAPDGDRALPVASSDATRHGQPKIATAQIKHVKVYDRHGESLNLYDDIVRGRTVAFNFITAPCAVPCEQANVFRETQRRMGERLGPYVKLITVVVAGTSEDQAATLQRMAAEYGAGDAWMFVAVDEGKLTMLLDALGVPAVKPRVASPLPPLVVFNDSTGYSMHLDGASAVTLIIKSIDEVSSADPVVQGLDEAARPPLR